MSRNIVNFSKNTGSMAVTFKTDNNDLFDFSLESAKESNWNILIMTRDLHKSEYNEGNIMTEYEKKFSGLGHNINMMVISQENQ